MQVRSPRGPIRWLKELCLGKFCHYLMEAWTRQGQMTEPSSPDISPLWTRAFFCDNWCQHQSKVLRQTCLYRFCKVSKGHLVDFRSLCYAWEATLRSRGLGALYGSTKDKHMGNLLDVITMWISPALPVGHIFDEWGRFDHVNLKQAQIFYCCNMACVQ